jgi:hypothetical protein
LGFIGSSLEQRRQQKRTGEPLASSKLNLKSHVLPSAIAQR